MKYTSTQIKDAMGVIAALYRESVTDPDAEHAERLNNSIDIALDSMDQVILIRTVVEDDVK